MRFVLVISSFAFFTSCNLFGPKDYSEDYKFGLKLATKEQLRSIPMASTPFSGESLPPVVDLSPNLPPIGDQGLQSSCVGWSVGYGLKAYEERIESNQTVLFSPSYIYNQLNNGQDGGINIIDAMNLISQQGAGLWSDMPYSDKDFTRKPTRSAIDNASKYKIDFWRQVNVLDIKEVKAQVNAGFPVVIGTVVDEGFINDGINMKAAYVWSKAIGRQKGNHAMLVIGYDDNKKAFKAMNSWGTKWGDNGYAWIDYMYFPSVVKEGYVAKDATGGLPEKKDLIIQKNNNFTINKDTVTNNPTEFLSLKFEGITVSHNQPDPNGVDGNGMIIAGRAEIPAGYGKTFQIAIYVNDEAGNGPVKSLIPNRYSDPTGNAASATSLMQIPLNGIANYYFKVFLPYAALSIPYGQYINGQYQSVTTNMWAKPILFIDNYAVGYGELHKFFVTR
ncbi:MAG: C1 family peptidase [Bacteroidetes bacterium]|nr:C1 family peptidase [Bacteroidota bacterium]